MTDYILGNDQSWSGWGRCLATKDGPIWADHVANLGRKTYRWHALAAELARLDEMCPRPAEPGTIRLVAEKPPMKMSKQGSRRRGADVAPQTPASVFGMGTLAGPLLTWGARPGWLSPWLVDIRQDYDRRKMPKGPPGWRSWWGITGCSSRRDYKVSAICVVDRYGWGELLEPYGWRKRMQLGQLYDICEKAAGDVAESILIAVGAARHPEQAPRSPKR